LMIDINDPCGVVSTKFSVKYHCSIIKSKPFINYSCDSHKVTVRNK